MDRCFHVTATIPLLPTVDLERVLTTLRVTARELGCVTPHVAVNHAFPWAHVTISGEL